MRSTLLNQHRLRMQFPKKSLACSGSFIFVLHCVMLPNWLQDFGWISEKLSDVDGCPCPNWQLLDPQCAADPLLQGRDLQSTFPCSESVRQESEIKARIPSGSSSCGMIDVFHAHQSSSFIFPSVMDFLIISHRILHFLHFQTLVPLTEKKTTKTDFYEYVGTSGGCI